MDTNVVIWVLSEPHYLSKGASEVLTNPASRLYVSVVSLWELQIKSNNGKITLPYALEELDLELNRQFDVIVLPIVLEDVYALQFLEDIHRDPFDRMLVAQARSRNLTILTADKLLKQYGVPTVW
ncbi:MAG: type II toxin-antitoxin system VapC family toxin [Anaerolineae bacterium]|nr:type II toxin-antitoxin system VapC family toxin [Anaerolineae bacterium]